MVRLAIAAAGVVSLVGVVGADDPTAVRDERKALDGSWSLVSADVGGQKLPEAVTKTFTLVMKGDEYAVKSGGPDDTGTVKLDPSKQPKELDVVGVEGPNKGKTFPAIYDLDGDTLKVCYDLGGKKRPAEFKAAPGTKQFMAVYTRKKG